MNKRAHFWAVTIWRLFDKHGSDGLNTTSLLRGNEVYIFARGDPDSPNETDGRVYKIKVTEIPNSKLESLGISKTKDGDDIEEIMWSAKSNIFPESGK